MWSRTRWMRVRRAADRISRRGTRQCARGNRTRAVWRPGCAAYGRSARRCTGYIRPARCGIRPIRTVRFPPRPRCPCGPRNPPSPVRAGWTTGCSSPSMPANESDAAAVPSLNLRSSASSNARNPAESIVNGVRMVCSLSVAWLRAPAPQLAAGAHGCHIPMLLAPTPRPERRMWIGGRHSSHPQPPCRLWMDAARSGFFQPVFRLVICFLAYSSIL